MNIFNFELKRNFKPLIFWAMGIIFYTTMGMVKFSGFASDESSLEIIKTLPKAIVSAFSLDALNLSTLTGYVGVMFSYTSLLLAIHAVIIGSGILSKEERDKTCEFILTLPVSREKLLISKIFAGLLNCLILLLVLVVSELVAIQFYEIGENFYPFFWLLCIAHFFIQLIFFSFGILLSSIMKNFKRTSNLALGFLISLFFLSIIQGLTEKTEFLKYFTPFKFFDIAEIYNNMSLNLFSMYSTILISVVMLIVSYLIYPKRDLYV